MVDAKQIMSRKSMLDQKKPSVDDQLQWRATELLQALPVAVYTTDASGVITAYNDAAAELWGVRPEIGVDKWCGSFKLRWPDGAPMDHHECPMAVALRENREVRGGQAIAERPDGSRVPFLAFPTPLRDEKGALIGAVNTLVDITDQEHRKAAEWRLGAIVDSSHDAIVSKDLNGIIASWNHSAQALFGYTAEEVIGKPITILIPEDRQEEEPQILQRIRSGERVDHFETIRRHKDGRLFPISLTISPIHSDDGTIVGISKIARDITDQKESEQRIHALMREVNHRVKNQFAVIISMIRETNKHTKDSVLFVQQVQERILALSRSHDLLVQEDWRGATVFELLLSQLKPFGHEDRVTMAGPSMLLQPMALQHLGIAFHELATNSVKYGALSRQSGRVRVEWSVADGDEGGKRFRLVWTESGGPRVKAAPDHGFGSVVLRRVAPTAMSGKATLDYLAEGVVWSLDAPVEYVQAQNESPDAHENRMTALEEALRQP
jgi:PAS domain S-box-containing protein